VAKAKADSALERLKAAASDGELGVTVSASGGRRQVTVRREGLVLTAESDTIESAAVDALDAAGELWPELVA
jgi:hypothetical protein